MKIHDKLKRLYVKTKHKVKDMLEDIKDLITSCVTIENQDVLDIEYTIDEFSKDLKYEISVYLKHEVKALIGFIDDVIDL